MDMFSRVKWCRVCGAKAICFNFNVLTCNPCRIFFNRNMDRLKELKCHQSGTCKIDNSTRKCCSKCRLDKCVAIGMTKDACSDIDHKKLIESEKISEKNISDKPNFPLKKQVRFPKKRQILINPTKDLKKSFQLTSYELQKMRQIHQVMQVFVDENSLEVIGQADSPATAFNLTGLYFRTVVKFCKSIPAFVSLNDEDQMTILKPFLFESILIRIAFIYDAHKGFVHTMANESGSHALMVHRTIFSEMQNKELFYELERTGVSLQAQMENDLVIRDLITVLALFQSRHPVTAPEYLRYHYYVYVRLLHRYLTHKYDSVRKANHKLVTLVKQLHTVSEARQTAIVLLNEIGLCNLNQFIVEAFCLAEL